MPALVVLLVWLQARVMLLWTLSQQQQQQQQQFLGQHKKLQHPQRVTHLYV
jgi:hypothetical protein